MPSPANIELAIKLNGGAPEVGAVEADYDDVVVLTLGSTASGVKKAKYRIREYPEGFTLPAGWTNENGIYTATVANGGDAPSFTLPAAISALRGKYLFDVTANDRMRNGALASDLYYKATNLFIPFTSGIDDIGFDESDEFESADPDVRKRSYVAVLKDLVRRMDEGVAGTGDVTGIGSSVSGRIALFSGTSGTALQQSDRAVSDILRTSFSVLFYGAGTGETGADNATAFNAANVAANAAFISTGTQQIVLVPPGRYELEPSATSSWNLPLLGSTAEVHIAVELLSGVTWIFDEAEIVATPPSGADSAWQYALFGAADLNMTVGDLTSIKLLGLRTDFTTAFWTSDHSGLIGVLAVGVDDIEIRDMVCVRTAGTAGATGRAVRVMNCKRVKILGLDARNIAQGIYLNYSEDIEISARVEGAHEGMDIDQPCKRVRCFLTMINGTGSEQQGADIAGVEDGYFELFGENIGQMFSIYTKPDCHPTFADWVTNLPTNTYATAPVQPKRIKVVARGKNIHSERTNSAQISLRRNDDFGAGYWNGKGLAKDITLDVAFEDSDPVIVLECENLNADITLDDTNIDGEAVAAGTNNFALVLRSEHVGGATPLTESKLSGRVRATIRNSERGGIYVLAPTDLELEANIQGYNSIEDAADNAASGVFADRLAAKPGILTIKNLRIGGGDLTVTPADLRLSNSSATGTTGATVIRDLGGHRLTSGGTPVAASAGTLLQGGVEVVLATIDTSSANQDYVLRGITAGGARLIAAYAMNPTAISGTSGTNYTSLSMRRLRAGTVGSAIGTDTPYDNVDRAAGAIVDLQVDGTDSDGVYVAGDAIAVRASRQGTGSTRTNILLKLVFAEYSL